MEITTAVKATEQEIIDLILKRFEDIDYDSIVAMEELGNQAWAVDVSPATPDEKEEFYADFLLGESMQFRTRTLLDILCLEKTIPAGAYIIDCTW